MKNIIILLLFACSMGSNCLRGADNSITFGTSGSFAGHFGFYGTAIKHGIEAYFNRINATGGIQAKKLNLVTLEDNGNPELTKKNIESLRQQGIKLFVGVMGTRGILSILDLLQHKKIALFFPWGNDPALRNPSLTHIINGPGLLETQVEALAQYVATDLKLNNVAIFNADDEFSSQGATALKKALEQEKIKIVGAEEYNRFTLDIAGPAHTLIKKSPRVVIAIATGMPTVQMVNEFFASGSFGTTFLGTEGTFLAKNILKRRNIDFKFSSPVPDAEKSALEIAQNYKIDMAQYFPDDELTPLSFTYYICAAIIGAALQKIPDAITQEKLLQVLESFKKSNVLGFPIDFDETNRFIFGKQVWII